MLNIVIFGPPGVGKGTQSDLLIKKFNLTHISTGDILRDERNRGTELGLIAKEYHEQGNLVPSDIINKIMDKAIRENVNSHGLIIDGYPRRVDQAAALDTILGSLGECITLVIALDAGDDVVRERLLERGKTSGRPDDKDISIINTRLEVYKTETKPVLDYYGVFGKLHIIDGTASIENISEWIEGFIENANTSSL